MTSGARPRAVALLSGGLDSALALWLVRDQGWEVVAFHVRTPFAGEYPGEPRAVKLAATWGVPCECEDAGPAYLAMLKRPRFGRGAAFNPCIDCHIYMLRRAAAVMVAHGAALVVTGEVLGQRPMSQHGRALALVEREAGLEGRLLRPLSARLLPETDAERRGWLDREKLLALEGRSRKVQLDLARARGVEGFSSPAGGCLLTDRNFGARLADAFAHGEDADVDVLRWGRHFRLPSGAKAIVGRREAENERLGAALAGDAVAFQITTAGSPLTLLLHGGRADWPVAAALTLRYSDIRDRPTAEVTATTATGEKASVTARSEDAAAAPAWFITAERAGKNA